MRLLVAAILVFMTNHTMASIQVGFSTSYIKHNRNYEIGSSETKYEETRQPMDFKIGTVLSSKIYLGIILDMGTRTVESVNNKITEKHSGTGATIGYDGANYLLHFSYFFTGEFDFDTNTKFTQGSGFQLDWGYKISWGKLMLVPQISYVSMSYKTRDVSGTETSIDSSNLGGLIPKIGLMLEF
jgi:hypothetical protein